jgi:hypothetical protein
LKIENAEVKVIRAFSLIVFCLFSSVTIGQELKPETISPKDWVMPPEAAATYLTGTLHPLLEKAMKDPTYPPGISRRIALLFTEIQSHRMLYFAEPAYYPTSKIAEAHLDYDASRKKQVLMVFIPCIIDEKPQNYPPGGFELFVAIIFAHEYAHSEYYKLHPLNLQASKRTREMARREEAEVWGVTILEMIRPALAQHRWLPPTLIHASEEFKKAGDNATDPGWIAAFKNYAEQ